jgi:hypothetical protein
VKSGLQLFELHQEPFRNSDQDERTIADRGSQVIELMGTSSESWETASSNVSLNRHENYELLVADTFDSDLIAKKKLVAEVLLGYSILWVFPSLHLKSVWIHGLCERDSPLIENACALINQ